MSCVADIAGARRSSERRAILSSCCGMLGEVTLTDSAVIILFAGMLGAGDMLSMTTTAILPFLNGLLVIPMAFLSARKLGERRLVTISCALAAAAYFLAAAAPFFGGGAVASLMTALVLFALMQTGFVAGWFPFLDTFLEAGRRAEFFGRMRFSHQLTAVAFLLLVSLVVGKGAPVWMLQAALATAAVIFTGRLFFIMSIPAFQESPRAPVPLLQGLTATLKNNSLRRLSVYQFVLNLTIFSTVPLAMLYLKNSLGAPDNIIVLASASALAGMLLGYLLGARILRLLGMTRTLVLLHAICIPGNIGLFFIDKSTWPSFFAVMLLVTLSSFAIAASSIAFSAEMMSLASHANKAVDMAFGNALYNSGAGLARLICAALLGWGLMPSDWGVFGMSFSSYQALFLANTAAALAAAMFLPWTQEKEIQPPAAAPALDKQAVGGEIVE